VGSERLHAALRSSAYAGAVDARPPPGIAQALQLQGEAMHLGSHILVPLDGSPLAQEALPLGLALGRRQGRAGELVHVHERPPIPASGPHADPRFDREPCTRARRTRRGGVHPHYRR